jgi:hypothetical protein
MAIAKISRPRRVGSTVRYLTGPLDNAGRRRDTLKVVASTIGIEPDMAVKFLNHVAKLRPRLNRHLYHVSISASQTDRELSQKDWTGIGRSWCVGMGIENYMIVLHDAHIHILGSRIRFDGTVASDKNDYRRSELLLRKIEAEFDLEQTPSSHLVDRSRRFTHQRARSMKELHAVENDGHSHKDFIRAAIEEALSRVPDETRMRAALAEAGIDMMIEQKADGTDYVLFGYHGHRHGPRSLGQGYSLTNLVQKGLRLSGLQTATAHQIPVPPWALDVAAEANQPRRPGNHDEAVRRLRGVEQGAREVINHFRIAKRTKNGPPDPDRHDAGQLSDDEPPDVT